MGSFYTDVLQNDSRFESTKRINDVALLEPTMRAAVAAIIADADAHGISLMVWETYRSQARQQQLFEHGVSKLRRVGVHHYGLACDLVRDVDGEPSWKGDFSSLGTFARGHLLIWGGDWGRPDLRHSFVDEYHVQRCSLQRQASLFANAWYPDASYDPYADAQAAISLVG
jgi:hypothetical protein